jgi:hypothetical protein
MNDSQLSEFFIQWSIRVSCGLVYGRLLCRLWHVPSTQKAPTKFEYRLWTAGFLFFGLHVFLSFHFIHQWRHDEAWLRTAIETENLVGVRRGDGVWANYLMLVIWGIDILRIRKARRLQRCDSVFIDRIVGSFIGFMFINATIVFGPEFYRHLLFPALVLAFLFWRFGPGTSGIAIKTRWDD